jgi:hypothetical protein
MTTIRDRGVALVICAALMVLALDTSRLPGVHRGVWASLYILTCVLYFIRSMLRRPPSWLRGLSLSSLLFVTQMHAWALWSIDGRRAPLALATIICVLAFRERTLTLSARHGQRG